jgi:hypothetical protein
VIRKLVVRAAGIAALMLAVSSASASGAAVVGHGLGAFHARDFASIENVRCCGWGPRGWYDTWRNCHYCGFGPPYYSCRWSVRRAYGICSR